MKRFAIPVAQSKLCAHFGHCEVFRFIDVDEDENIISRQDMDPPAHVPGVIPPWVAQNGANIVLAGGMGGRAISLFEQAGVSVVTGCPSEEPDELVRRYIKGTLVTGSNACNHDEEGHNCGH